MKNLKFLLLAILLIAPLMIFAQDDGGDILNLNEYATTFSVFITTVLLVTQMFKDWVKIKGTTLVTLSWSIGVVLAALAYFANIGFFEPLTLLDSLLYGIGASLVSNGIASVGIVQTLLTFIIGLITKKKAA